jgi:hypothetical protein
MPTCPALGRAGVPVCQMISDQMIAGLLSEENRWVNGQRIEVSGGMALRRLSKFMRLRRSAILGWPQVASSGSGKTDRTMRRFWPHGRQAFPYRIAEGLPVIRPIPMPSAEITSTRLMGSDGAMRASAATQSHQRGIAPSEENAVAADTSVGIGPRYERLIFLG